jgi:ubiquinone/menaquinone biosynthesis C-methylase UbiE
MNNNYDPHYLERHYDEFGLKEWDRFSKSIRNEVNLLIHTHYLRKYVPNGSKVLEIGAGPGRFTIELAKLDCAIAVVDISNVQLELNKDKVTEAGFEKQILWRKKIDITDLSSITETFDVIVIYGGPLSYIFDKIAYSLEQVFNLVNDKGIVLFSVMSLHGTVHYFIKELFDDEVIKFGLDEMDRVNQTGDLTGDIARGHVCKMYSWNELEKIIKLFPCNILAISASNYLSNTKEERLTAIRNNPAYWKKFLDWEIRYTADLGSVNNGSHIIVVLEKN